MLVKTPLISYSQAEDAVNLALVMKQHVLLLGPPGTGKSLFADMVFSHFPEAKVFKIQFSKFTSEEALFGVPNIKKLREEGVIHYVTPNTILEADFAFLDELFDANDALMRSLLQILNERRFAKGSFKIDNIPLWSAIATSNYQRINNVTEAVIDRFLFRVTVPATEQLSSDNLVDIILFKQPQLNNVNLDKLRELHDKYIALTNNGHSGDTVKIIANLAKELNWSPRRARMVYHAYLAAKILGWGESIDTLARVAKLTTTDSDEQKVIEEKTTIAAKAAQQLKQLEDFDNKFKNLGSCTKYDRLSDIANCVIEYQALLNNVLSINPATEEVNKKKADLESRIRAEIESVKNYVLKKLEGK